jgi:hypothetical protein
MTLSANTIIGLIALLIMCFPAVLFLIRVFRRYGYVTSSSPSPPQSEFRISRVASDDSSLMENGMIYAAVSVSQTWSGHGTDRCEQERIERRETIMIYPTVAPQGGRPNGSEGDFATSFVSNQIGLG